MSTKWRKKPTKADNLSNVDYLFAIDENGTSTIKNAKNFNDNSKWFTVTGVLIDLTEFNDIRQKFIELKEKHWTEGLYKSNRVVLHSKDIRKKQGPFNPKLIDLESFSGELNELLSWAPVKVYSANIDKYRHWQQYHTPYPVYELGIEFIMERFSFEMRRKRAKGAILLESRGFKEDKDVLHKMKNLIDFGSDFIPKENFECISGVYFNPKLTDNGKMSYWPLEISDIISYSVHQYVKAEKKIDTFHAIEEKIYGYPKINGRGLKIFPSKK